MFFGIIIMMLSVNIYYRYLEEFKGWSLYFETDLVKDNYFIPGAKAINTEKCEEDECYSADALDFYTFDDLPSQE